MEIKTYRAKRPLKMGEGTRQPGELAPEMNAYLRVDNYVHTGYLAEVWVSPADFAAAVVKFCPNEADKLFALAGYITPPEEEPASTELEVIEEQIPQSGAAKKAAAQIRSNK